MGSNPPGSDPGLDRSTLLVVAPEERGSPLLPPPEQATFRLSFEDVISFPFMRNTIHSMTYHVQTPYILQAFRGQKFSSHGSGAGKVGILQTGAPGPFHLDPAEHPMQLVWQ